MTDWLLGSPQWVLAGYNQRCLLQGVDFYIYMVEIRQFVKHFLQYLPGFIQTNGSSFRGAWKRYFMVCMFIAALFCLILCKGSILLLYQMGLHWWANCTNKCLLLKSADISAPQRNRQLLCYLSVFTPQHFQCRYVVFWVIIRVTPLLKGSGLFLFIRVFALWWGFFTFVAHLFLGLCADVTVLVWRK